MVQVCHKHFQTTCVGNLSCLPKSVATSGWPFVHALGWLAVDWPLVEGSALVGKLQNEFVMDVQGPFSKPGDSCQFLKKYFHFNAEGIAIQPNEKHFVTLQNLLGIKEVKKLKSPVLPDLCKNDESEPLDQRKSEVYRKAVGLILYVSSDRPDVQYGVKLLSSAMSKPTVLFWKGLIRLSNYLLSTVGYAVQIKKTQPGDTWLYEKGVTGPETEHTLECYTDADWAIIEGEAQVLGCWCLIATPSTATRALRRLQRCHLERANLWPWWLVLGRCCI